MAITLLTPNFWVLRILLLFMATLSSGLPSQAAAPSVSQIYQFQWPIGVENLFPLKNGHLLITTSYTGNLYYIDPTAIYPAAQDVITLPGVTALTGMAEIGDGLYAINGGVPPPSSSDGYWQVHVVKIKTNGSVTATLVRSTAIMVPGTVSLYGMAALPKHRHTVLSADPRMGRILRVNTTDDSVSVAIEHAALGPGDNATAAALGIKGLRIRDDYLYFTNLAQRKFGRFPIDANGTNTGDVEILACLDEYGASYDDFAFDDEGNVFVAVHPSSIYKITPHGVQSTFAGGVNSTFLEPTSVVVSKDGSSLYVSTGGRENKTEYPAFDGGQVMKVQLGGSTCG
ncbi:hypothetical protein HD806DRAFT_467357 [Xylariaceae sp. AK1471]|nr:hypothetical protein HD806DRAFT_467357 [Xylariaceae sp. AK1471]